MFRRDHIGVKSQKHGLCFCFCLSLLVHTKTKIGACVVRLCVVRAVCYVRLCGKNRFEI